MPGPRKNRCCLRLGDVPLTMGLLLNYSAHAAVAATTKPWLQEHYPNPDSTTCRGSTLKSHRICDPDGILSQEGLEKVEGFLQTKRTYIQTSEDCLLYGAAAPEHEKEETETTTTTTTTTKEEAMELQMGVALVNKMDLTPFGGGGGGEEGGNGEADRAAETFARYVHDQWGVGVETESCGGAGILLFLSIQDRTIYISRGAALEHTLTDRRLDHIMEAMKDSLRSQQYDTAILQALHDIQQYIHKGPPTQWENLFHNIINLLFPAIWLCTLLSTVIRNAWVNSRMQREYARVKSQLSEIDRAQAQALQGKYNCTSCPICLEDFQPPTTEGGLATIGSDGLPIKLLRCGHVMDETCWSDWINSGRGTITKCPICMQDIGEAPNNNNNSNNNAPLQDRQQQQEQQPRRRHANHDNNNNNNNRNLVNLDNNQHADDDDNNWNQHEQDRVMRQYRRERNFRLARLGARYPRIVRQAQIQRWSNPTYEGQLVRDPGFVQSNPSLATTTRPATGGGGMRSGGGFGGSSSAGGRGGRW